LRHNGVAFPPLYEKHGLTVKIKNSPVALDAEQEEMLIAWAGKLETPYVQDEVFQRNFVASLRKRWPDTFGDVKLADIDFSDLKRTADDEKLSKMPEEKRKQVSAERKKKREELKAKYGTATVDDIEVEVGAYLVEPPGIFMGRGAHPLRGTWKKRVTSNDVELNLDADAPTPEPMDGGQWKRIVHEHSGLWIARWQDELADKLKYVWLAETSHLRQEREKMKFVKAARLDTGLERVRNKIRQGMASKNERERKVATVAYLIDRMAMRVGDEKDDDEADTVGASTLRVEHVKIHPDRIDFDFLGKDSVRWEKSLAISGPDRVLANNLREFSADKKPGEQIFPEIRSAQVNQFLSKIQPGLSAKVFRTFHATTTVKEFLEKKKLKRGTSVSEKEYWAKRANLEAAIRCNHKRTPPKTWEESLRKKQDALAKLQETEPKTDKQRERLKERIEKAQRQLDLARETRDYNLNTSLKNYIDPRVFKAWGDAVDFDWTRLYTQVLQRKFSWMKSSRIKWDSLSGHSLARLGRSGNGNSGEEEKETAQGE
jgi:DNA topoisomerase-1